MYVSLYEMYCMLIELMKFFDFSLSLRNYRPHRPNRPQLYSRLGFDRPQNVPGRPGTSPGYTRRKGRTVTSTMKVCQHGTRGAVGT